MHINITSSPISTSKIAALNHKIRYHSMEYIIFEPQVLLGRTFLASTQRAKVLCQNDMRKTIKILIKKEITKVKKERERERAIEICKV